MRAPSPREIEAVLRLDGPARYQHFVKRAADAERVWGLWKNGWASMADSEGRPVFPLWPAKEYAALCASGDWEGYVADEIPLQDLLDDLLPRLAAQEARPGVFPVPSGKGVTPSAGELIDALRLELERYG